jgi:ABC-type glycerol-3-phosphate transport system permease component
MFQPKRPVLAFTYLRFTVLILIAALVLAPFFWLLCSAFKMPAVLMKYTFLPPIAEWGKELSLSNFKQLFKSQPSMEGKVYFWQYITNSLFLASITTIVQMFFSSLGGYALAKYDFKGKKFVMFFMLASMMIPGVVLLAPVYELIVRIGLMDTYWALVLPGASSVFGMFLFRQAIVGIPNDLIEAGRIDGCGEFSIYLNLIMPLVRPMTGAFCLVTFLGSWNNFLGPQVYINTQAKLTLPVVLNQYVTVYANQYGVFLAGTLLAIIPPAILFFCLQKEFISGLSSGAVKG